MTALRVLGTAAIVVAGFIALHGQTDQPPNIVIILADDMGYGDLGAFGNPMSAPQGSMPWLPKDRSGRISMFNRSVRRAGPRC
jgi:hypothetical protein